MTSSTEGSRENSIASLTAAVQEFALDREWGQFHTPKNLVMSLVSEVGELAGILRWVRGEESDRYVADGSGRDELQAEIGDVGICLLLLCARANVDLGAAIRAKLSANAVKYPLNASRGRAEPPLQN